MVSDGRSFLSELSNILFRCRKDRDKAVALHLVSCICEDGIDHHVTLANELVSLLVEIGSIGYAQQLFERLIYTSQESWNALIIGYIQGGNPSFAYALHHRLCQHEHARPTRQTSVALLNMCGQLRDLKKGEEIHLDIDRVGLLKLDIYVSTALLNMYTKCASLESARNLFDALSIRNVVTWTTLLAGYVEQGYGKEAITIFDRMCADGVSPNSITFVYVLRACNLMKDMKRAEEVHLEIEKRGMMDSNSFIGCALVDMYAKCGLLMESHQIFTRFCTPNVACWTALISGYTEQNFSEAAVQLFRQMQLEGMCPDFGSLVCALKACGKAGALLEGIKIHVDLNEQGLLERDHFACTTLLDMYAKCGYLGKARQVFDRLKVKSVVSWNALLAGYVEAQQAEDALKCFQKLQMEKIHPTAVTFICALRACAAIGAEDKGEEIHGQIERQGLLARDPLGNTLIHMYARCGSLRKAQKVFDKLLYRDIFSFTTLMMGYAQLGESDSVFDTFDKMLMEGVKPNPVTFLVLLTACNRAGLFIKSQTYYEAMSQKFGVCMTVKHSCCVVDLLSRIGHIENALAIMHKMKDLPDFVMWHAVHNACRKLGNMKVHEQVFQQAWCFERMNSTPNVACLTT